MRTKNSAVKYIIEVLFCLIYIMPIWMVVVNSFKAREEANLMGLGLTDRFTLDNYAQIFAEGGVVRSFFNGLIQAGGSTLIVLLIGSLAAFVIARSGNKFISNSYYIFLAELIVTIAYIPT